MPISVIGGYVCKAYMPVAFYLLRIYSFLLYVANVANVANVASEYINITIKKNIGKVIEWNATTATETKKQRNIEEKLWTPVASAVCVFATRLARTTGVRLINQLLSGGKSLKKIIHINSAKRVHETKPPKSD